LFRPHVRPAIYNCFTSQSLTTLDNDLYHPHAWLAMSEPFNKERGCNREELCGFVLNGSDISFGLLLA